VESSDHGDESTLGYVNLYPGEFRFEAPEESHDVIVQRSLYFLLPLGK
jgi:hypothetical protein